MNEKSVGGKLPVYVYDVKQWFKQQQNKVQENVDNIVDSVTNNTQQGPVRRSTTSTPINTGEN
jgi:hypothetical protein